MGELAREVGLGMGRLCFFGLLCLGDGIRYGLLLLSCEMEDLVWGNDGPHDLEQVLSLVHAVSFFVVFDKLIQRPGVDTPMQQE